VLIAATDPVAVIAMFKDNRTEGRLRLLVESESLFNDGVAAVLFTLAVAGMQVAGTSTWFDAGKTLLLTAGGGIAIGLACAALAVLVVGRTIDHLVESTLTTVAAYGSFLLAERFHVSGVPSTVTAGLVVGSLAVLRDDERSRMTQRGREFVLALWPELTNWPSGTHKGTYQERFGAKAA
jgi:CPA1 family monovalent cation:H+ antiporter